MTDLVLVVCGNPVVPMVHSASNGDYSGAKRIPKVSQSLPVVPKVLHYCQMHFSMSPASYRGATFVYSGAKGIPKVCQRCYTVARLFFTVAS